MLKCSHVLCKVDDIRTAVRDYESLGFTIAWGSAPQRAHNALLWFPQGPFIELFQLPPAFGLLKWPMSAVNGAAAGERLARWARPGEGWRDLALETEDTRLDTVHAALRSSGVRMSRIMKGGRTRPDGQRVRYQFAAPRPGRLPFVVSSYDPPQRPADTRHPNGARGISGIRMAVAAPERNAFDSLTGTAAQDGLLSVETADLTRVLSVELSGIDTPLDPALLHGAVFTAPARKG